MIRAIRPSDPFDDAPAAPIDERQLVDRIRAGDIPAFEELYQRYWTRLYSFGFRYLQSADEAEDLVQEVFFRIWRARDTWRVAGALDHYLYTAVRNAAFDRLEHAGVVARWRQGARADPAGTRAEAAAAAELEANELGAAVERALAELPEKRRAICMLRWVDGLTYAEIAARLGVAEKTVETQIGRGLQYLRERIGSLGG